MQFNLDASGYNPYHWHWYRNTYLSVWGERCKMKSWHCERPVRPVVEVHGVKPEAPEMKLVVEVQGKYSGKRLRPQNWRAQLTYAGHRYPAYYHGRNEAWSGHCTSVVDARRRADRINLEEGIEQILHDYYHLDRASRVLRNDNGKWRPFATNFYQLNDWHLPNGEYTIFEPMAGEWRQSRIRRQAGSCCGSSLPAGHEDELAQELRSW